MFDDSLEVIEFLLQLSPEHRKDVLAEVNNYFKAEEEN